MYIMLSGCILSKPGDNFILINIVVVLFYVHTHVNLHDTIEGNKPRMLHVDCDYKTTWSNHSIKYLIYKSQVLEKDT